MEVNLEDIDPQWGEFTHQGVTYRLRPFSLADRVWLQRRFPKLHRFDQAAMDELCIIAFNQLDSEQKQEFKKRKVKLVNEDGDSSEVMMGGVELFMAKFMNSPTLVKNLLQALLHTIGISEPIVKQITAELDAVKKKEMEAELTGLQFSTPFRPNTDGPQNISSHEQDEKFTGDLRR